jgi:hypothetical protein
LPGPARSDELTWSQLRPVLIGVLLVVDAFAVAALAIARPDGWLPPFLAFAAVLVGLVALLIWAIRHRADG